MEKSEFHPIEENASHPGIYHTFITPANEEVKATLLIVHGMQEHSGRYQEVANYFADRGFAVLTYDHLGHGKTVKKESDLGFFQIDNPGVQLIADAIEMGELLQQKYPEVPRFVLGHSMGSFVTRCLLQEKGDSYAGAIIVGTGGRLFGINILKRYFAAANRKKPRKRVKFNELFNYVNNRHFKNDKDYSPTSWLSVNVANRTDFENDEYCGMPFTNNGYYTLFSVYEQATNKVWCDRINKQLPFLFVSGEDDPIGNFGKGVKQAANDLTSHDFKDVSTRLYSNARHEILNELIKGEVFSDIYEWINQKL